MNEPKLNPCKYCGRPAVFKHERGSYGYTNSTVRIECTGREIRHKQPKEACTIRTMEYEVEDWERGYFGDKIMQQLADAWNVKPHLPEKD